MNDLRIPVLKIFETKEETLKELETVKKTHPAASIFEHPGGGYPTRGYGISKHSARCHCGMCPCLHDNGFFE